MCYNRDIKEREDLMKMLALQITFCVIGVVGSIFFAVTTIAVVRDMFF